MKIAYLWGVDFSNILMKHNTATDSVYVLLPDNEPQFPKETQVQIREQLADHAINVPYDQVKIAEQLLSIEADIVISMGWRRILGAEWFNTLQGRLLINIHPAILPQYKGYHTEPYVIINGEQEHGITAHHLTPELDDGKIIHQLRFPLSNFSTTASIKKQAYDLMPDFIGELMSLIHNGQIEGIAQDASLTKVTAPRRSPEDSQVDPEQPLADLYNRIRACDAGHYPAFFYMEGQKVFISMKRAADAQREHPLDL